MDKNADATHHEELALAKEAARHQATGTVRLIEDGEVILIPTPSPDPRDPLNLPQWHKWTITIVLGLFSVLGVMWTSGMGAILNTIDAYYDGNPRTSDLMTYPTLFMGIGNLIAMPVAMAVGRRPVFLASILLLTVGAVWCAASQSLGSHTAGRDILSLAAGQSEALCPLIIQEVHFVHERSRRLAWFSAIQSTGSAALIIATGYLVNSLGWRWWYGVFSIFSGLLLIVAFFLIPESRYTRPDDAYDGLVHVHNGESQETTFVRATTKNRPPLDFERHQARTLSYNLKIFHGPADWSKFTTCWKQMGQCILFPNILWVVLMNSAVLGIYVVSATEFATILASPPYLYPYTSLGLVQGGQIVVSMLMIPILGYGGDMLYKWMAGKRDGMVNSELRLIPITLPVVVTLISAVIFGQAGSNPTQWSSWAVVTTYNGIYFGFIGIVLIGFTYSLDSYGERAVPILTLICAIRGIISFGISFGVTDFVTKQGYNGALNICAIIMGVISAFGFVVFYFGAKIRSYTTKYAVDGAKIEI